MKASDLRASILQLAVEGQLVEQRPEEGTAAVLLDRFRAERAALVAAGKAKPPKGGESVIARGEDGRFYERRVDARGHASEPVCIEEEIPFDAPRSWEWARLSSLTSDIADGAHQTPNYLPVGVPFVTGKNISTYRFDLTDTKFISREEHERICKRIRPSAGDILFCRIGTLGRATEVPEGYEFSIFDTLGIIRPINSSITGVIIRAINSPMGDMWIDKHKIGGGTRTNKINLRDIANFLVPVPSLAEQERIGAKIDELMPLVDEYGRLEEARARLDADLPKRLRKSVLQLAVEGRLVEQRPEEGTAAGLLEEVCAKRSALVASGKAKPPKGGESVISRGGDGRSYERRVDVKGRSGEPVCIDDEIPFEIPWSWEWARLGSVAAFIGGGTPDKSNPRYWNGNIPWASMKDIHGNVLTSTIDTITEAGLLSKSSISICEPGQLIVSTRLNPGKVIVSDIRCAINQDLKVVLTALPVSYLSIWFKSHADAFRRLGAGTTVPGIKLEHLDRALIPVPPLTEQERIVAKVDELLALVDGLATYC